MKIKIIILNIRKLILPKKQMKDLLLKIQMLLNSLKKN